MSVLAEAAFPLWLVSFLHDGDSRPANATGRRMTGLADVRTLYETPERISVK
jgi:hypothetical protein